VSRQVQFKSFEFKVDAVDDKGVIRGYASTFGNVDYGLDVVDKGAFKKSLKENGGRVPILKDHDPRKLIGFNMRAQEDEYGLHVEGKLNLDVQDGREQYSLAKQAMDLGIPFGLSIGYQTIKWEPDRKDPNIRRLKELKLFEYSMVTFPMNPEAMITNAKGLVGVDKAKFFIEQLTQQGVSQDDLVKALGNQPPPELKVDPNLIQSIDSLISKMKTT
jgi:HK97 family phage prohead protease